MPYAVCRMPYIFRAWRDFFRMTRLLRLLSAISCKYQVTTTICDALATARMTEANGQRLSAVGCRLQLFSHG